MPVNVEDLDKIIIAEFHDSNFIYSLMKQKCLSCCWEHKNEKHSSCSQKAHGRDKDKLISPTNAIML